MYRHQPKLLTALAVLMIACAVEQPSPASLDDLQDSGWVGANSYEVDAQVESVVFKKLGTVEQSEMQQSPAKQAELVDFQLKFIKTKAEKMGWRFNQLAEKVEIVSVNYSDDGVSIHYLAQVDMIGAHTGKVPTLAEIEGLTFEASVPLEDRAYSTKEIQNCIKTGRSTVAHKFFYYFEAERSTCQIATTPAVVTITEVFDRPTVYPEYNRLLLGMGDGFLGFRAALVPNVGDVDPMSRFVSHATMLENQLKLKGVVSEDGRFTRYTWEQGRVRIVIDLFDPTHLDWAITRTFREQLGEYTLVHYNGHSAYGSQEFLDNPESFSKEYQIIMLHSCQSYAHYTRKIMRAKASEKDPSGFAMVDVVATGKSSHPSNSAQTVGALLFSLQEGLSALDVGDATLAPTWSTITGRMVEIAGEGTMYGVAGARTNQWQP